MLSHSMENKSKSIKGRKGSQSHNSTNCGEEYLPVSTGTLLDFLAPQWNRYCGDMVHTWNAAPQNCFGIITVTTLRPPQQSWCFSRTIRQMWFLHVCPLHCVLLHLQISCRYSTTDLNVLSKPALVSWVLSSPKISCCLPQINLLQDK